MAGGLLGVAAGALALLAIAPDRARAALAVGGFVLMGAGLGVASVASTARGTAAAGADDQGLASGLLATSAQLGTALGFAAIVPLAARGGGPAAQVAGYELGFTIAAAIAALAAALTITARGRRRARSGR